MSLFGNVGVAVRVWRFGCLGACVEELVWIMMWMCLGVGLEVLVWTRCESKVLVA